MISPLTSNKELFLQRSHNLIELHPDPGAFNDASLTL